MMQVLCARHRQVSLHCLPGFHLVAFVWRTRHYTLTRGCSACLGQLCILLAQLGIRECAAISAWRTGWKKPKPRISTSKVCKTGHLRKVPHACSCIAKEPTQRIRTKCSLDISYQSLIENELLVTLLVPESCSNLVICMHEALKVLVRYSIVVIPCATKKR